MRELDWFDGPEQEEQATGARPRRRLLLVLAAVPWLVVAALLALPLADGPGEPAARDRPPADRPATPASDEQDPDEQDPDEQDPTAADGTAVAAPGGTGASAPDPATVDDPRAEATAGAPVLTLEELRGRWRVAPGQEELASFAVIMARAHLSGVGPRLEIEGAAPASTTYAEHLLVEAVEHPSSDTAVVTVLAIVLVDDATEPTAVRLRRLAVPMAIGDGPPAPAGTPWELPAPHIPAAPSAALEPVEDADLVRAADTALAVAGLGSLRTTGLSTAPGWPYIATTVDPDGAEGSVWLRRHLDGLVVAGSTLAGSPAEEEQQ